MLLHVYIRTNNKWIWGISSWVPVGPHRFNCEGPRLLEAEPCASLQDQKTLQSLHSSLLSSLVWSHFTIFYVFFSLEFWSLDVRTYGCNQSARNACRLFLDRHVNSWAGNSWVGATIHQAVWRQASSWGPCHVETADERLESHWLPVWCRLFLLWGSLINPSNRWKYKVDN